MEFQHELIVCDYSRSNQAKKAVKKEKDGEAILESSSVCNHEKKSDDKKDHEDDDDDDDDDHCLELTPGENWLRIQTLSTLSVLQTQPDEDNDEAFVLSQQTTQDPSDSVTTEIAPQTQQQQQLYATILSLKNLGSSSDAASLTSIQQPSDECYICLDVLVDGPVCCSSIHNEDDNEIENDRNAKKETGSSCLTVKDMRWPTKESETYCRRGKRFETPSLSAVDTPFGNKAPSSSCLGICRRNQHPIRGWKCLPRRQLTVLYPGDRICTDLQIIQVKGRPPTRPKDDAAIPRQVDMAETAIDTITLQITLGGLVLEYRACEREISPPTQQTQTQQYQQVVMSQLSMSQFSQTQTQADGSFVDTKPAGKQSIHQQIQPADSDPVDMDVVDDKYVNSREHAATPARATNAPTTTSQEDLQHDKDIQLSSQPQSMASPMMDSINANSTPQVRMRQERMNLLLRTNEIPDVMRNENDREKKEEDDESLSSPPSSVADDENRNDDDSDKTVPMSQLLTSQVPQNVMAIDSRSVKLFQRQRLQDGTTSTASKLFPQPPLSNVDDVAKLKASSVTETETAMEVAATGDRNEFVSTVMVTPAHSSSYPTLENNGLNDCKSSRKVTKMVPTQPNELLQEVSTTMTPSRILWTQPDEVDATATLPSATTTAPIKCHQADDNVPETNKTPSSPNLLNDHDVDDNDGEVMSASKFDSANKVKDIVQNDEILAARVHVAIETTDDSRMKCGNATSEKLTLGDNDTNKGSSSSTLESKKGNSHEDDPLGSSCTKGEATSTLEPQHTEIAKKFSVGNGNYNREGASVKHQVAKLVGSNPVSGLSIHRLKSVKEAEVAEANQAKVGHKADEKNGTETTSCLLSEGNTENGIQGSAKNARIQPATENAGSTKASQAKKHGTRNASRVSRQVVKLSDEEENESRDQVLQPPKRRRATKRKNDQAVASSEIQSPSDGKHSASRRPKRKASTTPEATRKSLRVGSPAFNGEVPEDCLALAKARYDEVFAAALSDKVVNMVSSSNLSSTEATLLTSLTSKKSYLGGVKLRLCDDVNEESTVLIVPGKIYKNRKDVQASIRSEKAMRAALLGIPMVTPDWLKACKVEERVVTPSSFIQTLPTKSKKIEASGESTYGVAKLAASWKQNKGDPRLPFTNTFVYLCGNFPLKRYGMEELLQNGSATILLTAVAASSKLQEVRKAIDGVGAINWSVVIVCGDTRVSLSKALEEDFRLAATKESSSGSCSSPEAMIVGWQWVVESITCGKFMPPSLFPPVAKRDLWQLCLIRNASR